MHKSTHSIDIRYLLTCKMHRRTDTSKHAWPWQPDKGQIVMKIILSSMSYVIVTCDILKCSTCWTQTQVHSIFISHLKSGRTKIDTTNDYQYALDWWLYVRCLAIGVEHHNLHKPRRCWDFLKKKPHHSTWSDPWLEPTTAKSVA